MQQAGAPGWQAGAPAGRPSRASGLGRGPQKWLGTCFRPNRDDHSPQSFRTPRLQMRRVCRRAGTYLCISYVNCSGNTITGSRRVGNFLVSRLSSGPRPLLVPYCFTMDQRLRKAPPMSGMSGDSKSTVSNLFKLHIYNNVCGFCIRINTHLSSPKP